MNAATEGAETMRAAAAALEAACKATLRIDPLAASVAAIGKIYDRAAPRARRRPHSA